MGISKRGDRSLQKLVALAKEIAGRKESLPFSLYSSRKEQHLINVPIISPVLVVVLGGVKMLGNCAHPTHLANGGNEAGQLECPAGNFVFLSNSPVTQMRNIPRYEEYLALLIEFDYEDFTDVR